MWLQTASKQVELKRNFFEFSLHGQIPQPSSLSRIKTAWLTSLSSLFSVLFSTVSPVLSSFEFNVSSISENSSEFLSRSDDELSPWKDNIVKYQNIWKKDYKCYVWDFSEQSYGHALSITQSRNKKKQKEMDCSIKGHIKIPWFNILNSNLKGLVAYQWPITKVHSSAFISHHH